MTKNKILEKRSIGSQMVTSIRLVAFSMTICCVIYTGFILAIAQITEPHSADGSLVRDAQGIVIGSESIAQSFTRPQYFWPRPSAVDYNAAASGGSNLSPTNPELRKRAESIIGKAELPEGEKIPVDRVTASGSGLDPDITLKAAEFQAKRVAEARGMPLEAVLAVLHKFQKQPGGSLTPEPLVNVLMVNAYLDKAGK